MIALTASMVATSVAALLCFPLLSVMAQQSSATGFESFALWTPSEVNWCANVNQNQASGFSPPGSWCGGGQNQWCCVPNTCMTNGLMTRSPRAYPQTKQTPGTCAEPVGWSNQQLDRDSSATKPNCVGTQQEAQKKGNALCCWPQGVRCTPGAQVSQQPSGLPCCSGLTCRQNGTNNFGNCINPNCRQANQQCSRTTDCCPGNECLQVREGDSLATAQQRGVVLDSPSASDPWSSSSFAGFESSSQQAAGVCMPTTRSCPSPGSRNQQAQDGCGCDVGNSGGVTCSAQPSSCLSVACPSPGFSGVCGTRNFNGGNSYIGMSCNEGSNVCGSDLSCRRLYCSTTGRSEFQCTRVL